MQKKCYPKYRTVKWIFMQYRSDLKLGIGSQVVAGMNYCQLCKVTAVAPDAKPQYRLVYIYEELNGNAEITGSKTIIGETLPGGFEANTGDTSIYKNSEVAAARTAFLSM